MVASMTDHRATPERVAELMQTIHAQCVAVRRDSDGPPSGVVTSLACHALNQAGWREIKRTRVDFGQTPEGTTQASICGIRLGEHFINHLWGIVGAKDSDILEAFLAYRAKASNQLDTRPWQIQMILIADLGTEEAWVKKEKAIALREQACAALSSITMNTTTDTAPHAVPHPAPRRM